MTLLNLTREEKLRRRFQTDYNRRLLSLKDSHLQIRAHGFLLFFPIHGLETERLHVRDELDDGSDPLCDADI